MRKINMLIAGSLVMGALALTGCGSNVAMDQPSEETAERLERATVDSKVTIEGTYTAGTTVREQWNFKKNGYVEFGNIGQYEFEEGDDGYLHLIIIYYAKEEDNEAASVSYFLKDNGDGTYDRAVIYDEDDEPDFDDATATTLTPISGDDAIMEGESFDGVYETEDGTYLTLKSDGTFSSMVRMSYSASDDQLEMIGTESSTVYNYTANDDFSEIKLEKDGETLRDLIKEE